MNLNQDLKASPLGKKTRYHDDYTPELLFPIPREPKRIALNIQNPLPFYGVDLWNIYELSWLNQKGKPEVAIGKIIFPCDSPNIVESKSMKLYFNSFNNTQFHDKASVIKTIKSDLSSCAQKQVNVTVHLLSELTNIQTQPFPGRCIDTLDISIDEYQVNPHLLQTENEYVHEALYSNLLKSNCLATGQTDLASIQIKYQGKKINHESLLRYIVSYRNHLEFHEQCVERIYSDIMHQCQPDQLTIEAHYTRRGGIDINPMRSSQPNTPFNTNRQIRQ